MEQIGKYIIVEEIGRGGMGCVYKARDPIIERDVAIKVILERVLDVPEMRQRFYREARSAGRLAHDNIVVVHDVGEEDGCPYIVMEFLEGRDLRKAIDDSQLAVDQKLEIALWICKGLRYAHEHGVIHRDIKPENIRLVDGNRVKIVDFGIARLDSGTQTLTNASIGTPRYMSPEQIKGAAVDHRTDIFSFGVLLYELLMGNIPFQGDHVTTLVYKILHEEPEPIDMRDPRLTRQLQVILSKCLEKDVDRRYAEFGAVITDLQNVIRAQEATRTLTSDAVAAERDPGDTKSMWDGERLPADSGAYTPWYSRRTFQVIAIAAILAMVAAGALAVGLWPDISEETDMLAQSVASSEGRNSERGATDMSPPDASGTDEIDGGMLQEVPSEKDSAPPIERTEEPAREREPRRQDEGGGSAVDSAEPPRERRNDALQEKSMQAADASRDEMERARNRVEGPHENARVRSAFSDAEGLRRQGLDLYARNAFSEASASFQEAAEAYVRTGEVVAEQERHSADATRAAMLAAKEAVPPSVHQTLPYQRGLRFEEEGTLAYDDGDYTRADDRFSLAGGSFGEAGAPEVIVQAEARSIQENLRKAIQDEDWSSVPPLVRDGYYKHVSDIRRHWRITDVTISDQAPKVEQNGASATLPVTVTVHYVQPGGFDPGNYSLLLNWIWKESEGVLQLAQLQLVQASG